MSKPGPQLLGSSSARRRLESTTAEGVKRSPDLPTTPTSPHHPHLVRLALVLPATLADLGASISNPLGRRARHRVATRSRLESVQTRAASLLTATPKSPLNRLARRPSPTSPLSPPRQTRAASGLDLAEGIINVSRHSPSRSAIWRRRWAPARSGSLARLRRRLPRPKELRRRGLPRTKNPLSQSSPKTWPSMLSTMRCSVATIPSARLPSADDLCPPLHLPTVSYHPSPSMLGVPTRSTSPVTLRRHLPPLSLSRRTGSTSSRRTPLQQPKAVARLQLRTRPLLRRHMQPRHRRPARSHPPCRLFPLLRLRHLLPHHLPLLQVPLPLHLLLRSSLLLRSLLRHHPSSEAGRQHRRRRLHRQAHPFPLLLRLLRHLPRWPMPRPPL